MFTPTSNSLAKDIIVGFGVLPLTFAAALIKALPPPATIPSSMAALVALTASSTFSFKYFISVSVEAPTLITATPPESLAIRSSIFSISYLESDNSRARLSRATRFSISAFLPLPPTIMVLSLVAITFVARPSTSSPTVSSFIPVSSETTFPPTTIAMSSSVSFFLSPYPGALTAKILNVPRNLLTTKVARASPSTSSAIITSSFFPLWASFSRSGKISLMLEIFLSVISTAWSRAMASMRSGLVIIYGETYPLSNCIPSTISDSTESDWDSSTVTTPSLPTLLIVSAIMRPNSSDSAAMVATWAISSLVLISLAISRRALTTSSLA